MLRGVLLSVFLFLLIFFANKYFCEESNSLSIISEPENEPKIGKAKNFAEKSSKNDVFVPSDEWQVVREGQVIPAGLHVRLNLQTGEKEAKLLTKNGEKEDISAVSDRKYTINEIKEALKNVKKEDLGDFVEQTVHTHPGIEDEKEKIRGKFRSYEELKKEAHSQGYSVKSDVEIMRGYFSEYEKSTSARKLAILEDLEYYVHQIDNGANFVQMDGMAVLKDALNQTDTQFWHAAAFLLGSAAQSNPKVQVAALESGLLHRLIQTFFHKNNNWAVRKKYLYAVSSLLRNFPFAQKKFFDLGGSELIERIFASSDGRGEKLRLVTLLYDLLDERQAFHFEIARKLFLNQGEIQKLAQYRRIELEKVLKEANFCRHLLDLLEKTTDLDGQERILAALKVSRKICPLELERAKHLFHGLQRKFRGLLSGEEEEDEFVEGLLITVDTLLEFVGKMQREEL